MPSIVAIDCIGRSHKLTGPSRWLGALLILVFASSPVPTSAQTANPIAPAVTRSAVEAIPVVVKAVVSEAEKEADQTPGRFPIDLSAALQLAGANNLQIALARERVEESLARHDAARLLWVPSLRAGVTYTRHDGRIQATEGDVIEVSRQALFVGGGFGTGGSSLAGGAGGPARLAVNLPLADAIFEPLVARRLVDARQADEQATFNDTLLQVALAFFDLAEAHARVHITQQDVQNAETLAKTTQDFLAAQRVPRSDVARAQAELAFRRRLAIEAEEQVAIASAELVRLLRLDQTTVLDPIPAEPAPVELADSSTTLNELLAQALGGRPEVNRQRALVSATRAKARQESWRPWLPHLVAGTSGGGFGGGRNSQFANAFSGRFDFDAGAVWEFKNLGLGNRARLREARSRHMQAHLSETQIHDRIAADVTQAFHLTRHRTRRIQVAESAVAEALDSLRLNLDRIRGGEGLPIEVLQAIQALATARDQYLRAVSDHNRAQAALLRAIGQPIETKSAEQEQQ